MNGIFAVRKPVGPTSQDIVGRLKRILTQSSVFQADLTEQQKSDPKGNYRGRRKRHNFIKVGHGGTLDPLADGVLVIGVGTGTKELANYLGHSVKEYQATALFGASTTTYDSEGGVLEWAEESITETNLTDKKLQEALGQFRGPIKQLPPVFSALKMDGKPLYEYAREGIPLPRAIEPRDCTINKFEAGLLQYGVPLPTTAASQQEHDFAASIVGPLKATSSDHASTGATAELTFDVSSGTYIRTLIYDLGGAIGTPAHMRRLTRVKQGAWELGKNVLPVDLFDKPQDEWWPILSTVLKEGPQRTLEAEIMREGEPKEAAEVSEGEDSRANPAKE